MSMAGSITNACVPDPTMYDKQPLPRRRTWMTVASPTVSDAVSYTVPQASIPPLRLATDSPPRANAIAACDDRFPDAHTTTSSRSRGSSRPRAASWPNGTLRAPGMAHSANSSGSRKSRTHNGSPTWSRRSRSWVAVMSAYIEVSLVGRPGKPSNPIPHWVYSGWDVGRIRGRRGGGW